MECPSIVRTHAIVVKTIIITSKVVCTPRPLREVTIGLADFASFYVTVSNSIWIIVVNKYTNSPNFVVETQKYGNVLRI